jgi:uncharacterized protein YecA (UPF0149 family)
MLGILAESMMKYAQPLIDDTDGSVEELDKALSIARICWNLSIMPEEEREECFASMRSDTEMSKDEFLDFKDNVIESMILRHKKMFPNMFPKLSKQAIRESEPQRLRETKYPGTGRNDPCPCHSGKKHKKCCGN